MKKEFSMSNDKVTVNFTAKYCDSFESIMDSEGFERVIESYLKKSKDKRTNTFRFLNSVSGTDEIKFIRKYLISSFKLLSMMKATQVIACNENFEPLLEDPNKLLNVIEEIYSYWRKMERYTLIHNNRIKNGIAAVSFTEANTEFAQLILRFYRRITKNLLNDTPTVYRQLPAGGNACLMLNNVLWPIPKGYEVLEDISFLDGIVLETPFITYPKKNTRDGMFTETFDNPIRNISLNKEHWFCYPAKVGGLLAYVYFHRDFMSHGITLCNLFEMAKSDEYRGKKPDIIYVFGAKEDGPLRTEFYDDSKNDMMVGYVNYSDEVDYFGYMKKMILTLHNLIMIKRGNLPIHGAMVKILLKTGKEANVVIMGDSGAGKSESLEAFRTLSEDHISDMTIVFDDMGTIKIEKDSIYGYGTEIGAFVRLDDLDPGYAFKEIDRSIFMNPDKINARLVLPVATYNEIMEGYKVDLFLYANNYTDIKNNEKSIRYFETPKDAIEVFRKGARMAKGTTTENGLVESYFANPFGPAQKSEQCDILLDKYFNKMFEKGIKVGEINTCLAIKGKEKIGPRKAALELFEIIRNL
ncbi:phosphoenolpyruvate carboxykinase [Clostridium sp.]|uniref:phosphoenolpyruvate carboxykinase n=1 Tax=Clostridium sp. TaxID=1506 RepID=UPI0039956815